MNKKEKEVYGILARYLLIIFAAASNLFIFYYIFTPLTVYHVYFLLQIFLDVKLSGNVISLGHYAIWIIKACIAGSAYYLLFILNLSIPKINLKKRLKMISFSFLVLLAANILRIIILVLLLGSFWFDFTHKLFWNLLSTIFVVGIWFLEVKLFKIKKIPFYDDIKILYKNSFFKKSKRK
ncbi:MAG: pacearchaeosortase [Candidatus Pacearchaeota archaeon]|jgi:exosortase/archaeosortase family protein